MKKLTQPEDLLEVLAIPAEQRTPLAAEMSVEPELAPYLVTTTRSLMWHNKDFDGKVRAAFRVGGLHDIYKDILSEIVVTSRSAGWESCFDYSLQGLASALQYVNTHGLPKELEVLAPPDEIDSLLHGVTRWNGLPINRVDYLPPNTLAIIPKDKSYFGIALRRGDTERYLVLIHNPSRAIALVCPS